MHKKAVVNLQIHYIRYTDETMFLTENADVHDVSIKYDLDTNLRKKNPSNSPNFNIKLDNYNIKQFYR